jgi:hypothetical protein
MPENEREECRGGCYIDMGVLAFFNVTVHWFIGVNLKS